jgi:hypothetical protein
MGRTGTVSSGSGDLAGDAVGEPEFLQVGNVAVRGHKDNGEVYEATRCRSGSTAVSYRFDHIPLEDGPRPTVRELAWPPSIAPQ